MSLEQWEKKILDAPGAGDRVREIEDELRLAANLTALRERAGVSTPASPRSSPPAT